MDVPYGEGQSAVAPDTPAPAPQGQPEGQPGTQTPAAEGQTPQDGTPAAPNVPATPTVEVPEKLRGKRFEDAVSAFLEVEREKGRQAQELGELRQVVQYLVGQARQAAAPTPGPTAPPADPPIEIDWEKPHESIQRLVDRELSKREMVQRNAYVQELSQRAWDAHQRGREAMSKNRRLFEGIEQEVEQRMISIFGPQVSQGRDVTGHLADPAMWERAAEFVRVERREYDRLQATIKPVAPAPTEIPGKPQAQESAVDPAFMAAARANGKSEKEARELYELALKTYQG